MLRQIETERFLWLLLCFFFVVGLVACKGNSPKKPGMHGAEESNTISGKVAETMNSGGYTYILLDRKGVKTWVAVPEMQVSRGDRVTLSAGTAMANFHSNTLNRTFKEIIFSPGPVSKGNLKGANRCPSIYVKGSPTNFGMGMITPMHKVKVKRATGPNAYTIAELYEKRNELNNKQVVVRGKVIKALPMIMNRNWIHLQDGSGSEEKRNYDLVVTSNELPSVGDVVTFTGTLYADKDFGLGYKYKVIIEKGTMLTH